jgi:subtilisin family serine protease
VKLVYYEPEPEKISGMAPFCKLLSLRALEDDGSGEVSSIIAALEYVHRMNNYGRPPLRVHGVNISIGHYYDPEWFACGESPLCTTVNRLVRSGVVVVVAAGNSGFGAIRPKLEKDQRMAGLGMTINDPGNAELAITVGSTHRIKPHRYGASYFSSKGPTGDGRPKPDLLAPGERIISCRSSQMSSSQPTTKKGAELDLYREDTGTSQAAAHVSGVIAAFLSIRNEFIGRPEDIKKIFTETATDLHRTPDFQGHGLVDLMRAIQSV